MISFDKIKLVIWDLDDTFWSGTLTEGGVSPIASHIELVKKLTDCGIVNTICSKNDAEPVIKKLKEFGVSEYFVFNSIDWTPKGQRIATLLSDMGLRAVNALFLDDNPVNLNEAEYYSKGLMTGTPDDILALIEWASHQNPSDKEHKRLHQYQVLQSKQESKKSFSSNEEFLFNTHTRVEFKYDCLDKIDRIHELILRTNQLNFTKLRSTKEELEHILTNPQYECAYVNVQDDFGDYGTIGFYALDKSSNSLLHFLFSCRTIGQGVEQYVYAKLGHPQLTVVGEVINTVTNDPAPLWINQEVSANSSSQTVKSIGSGKILIKGPCDLESAMNYIKSNDLIDTEFTYVKEGTDIPIFAHNHSAHILDLLLSDDEKRQILEDCSFVDSKMLEGRFFSGKYDWIVLSTFIESDFGVYHKKHNPQIKVVIGKWEMPITEEVNRANYQIRTKAQPYYELSTDDIIRFCENYEYDGYTKPKDYISFLDIVLSKLPSQSKICLILGATKYHYDSVKIQIHKELNEAIKLYADSNERVRYIQIDDCIDSRADFTNQINHFKKIVYYKLSQKIVECVSSENASCPMEQVSKSYVFIDSIAWWISRHMKEGSFVKTFLRNLYRKIKGKS